MAHFDFENHTHQLVDLIRVFELNYLTLHFNLNMASMRRLAEEVELELYPSGYGVSDSDGDASDTLEDEIVAWEDRVSGGQGILADSRPPLKARRTEGSQENREQPEPRGRVRASGRDHGPQNDRDQMADRPHTPVGRGQGRGRGVQRGHFRPQEIYNRLGWRQVQFGGPRNFQWEGRRRNFPRENDYRRDQPHPPHHPHHPHYPHHPRRHTRHSPSGRREERQERQETRRDHSQGKRERSEPSNPGDRSSRPRQSRKEGRTASPRRRTPPLKASTPVPREDPREVPREDPREEASSVDEARPAGEGRTPGNPGVQEPVKSVEPVKPVKPDEPVKSVRPAEIELETEREKTQDSPEFSTTACPEEETLNSNQTCPDEQLRLALEGLKEVAESMDSLPPQGSDLPLTMWSESEAEVGEVLTIATVEPPQESPAVIDMYPEAAAIEQLGQEATNPSMDWRQPPASPGTSIASKSPSRRESVEGMGVLISCQRCDGMQNVPATMFLDALQPRAMTCRKCGGLILLKFSNHELWEIMK